MRSDEMPNYNLKLSHHEKRSLAWKVVVVAVVFMGIMFFGGLLHYELGITDPAMSIWLIAVVFIAIGAFGVGYIVRDKLPSRMNTRCKRFYYMGNDFGVWHWTRSQIFLADIFLVALPITIFGWSIAHTAPILLSGSYSFTDPTPLFYIPILYFPFWIEIVVEFFTLGITLIGFIYEVKTWILSKSGDYCYFEGVHDKSTGMVYDCDPKDPDCRLNERFG